MRSDLGNNDKWMTGNFKYMKNIPNGCLESVFIESNDWLDSVLFFASMIYYSFPVAYGSIPVDDFANRDRRGQ